jgi:hypothetical protein
MQASIEVMKDGGEVEVDVWACCVEATGLHLFYSGPAVIISTSHSLMRIHSGYIR